MNLAELIFWTCFAAVLHAYAGYPALLWIWTRFRKGDAGKPAGPPAEWPRCSVMLPAHNEEGVIQARLENLLALDYPAHLLEIIVGSDGSSDGTVEIVRKHLSSRVRLVEAAERGGKTALLNRMVAAATGDIIVFTDANCAYDPDAVRRLVEPFGEPEVGCVIGELVYVNEDDPTVGGGEGLYWRFENAIKEMESHLGGTLVANGSIYALRRPLFRPLPGSISDDSVNPLLVLRDGGQVRFCRSAVAREKAAARLSEEFRRKARMVTRQLGSHRHVRFFLWPPRPLLAFRLASHKQLRWLVPVFFLLAMAANLILLDRLFYRITFSLAVAGLFALVLGVWRLVRGRPVPRLLRVWVYFWMVNAAALKGLFDFLIGRRRAVWRISESTR